jgi:hypothetical protein
MAFLADLLTAARIVIAALIVLVGYLYGSKSIRSVILLLLLGWSTDILDGNLARRSATTTALGRFDFLFDFIMVASSFFYLMICGFVDSIFFYSYTLLLIAVGLFSRSQSLIMLFLAPLSFLPFFIAASLDRTSLFASVLWAFLAFLLDRHRFFGVIAEFAENFPGGYLKTTAEFFEKLSSDQRQQF